MLEHGAEVARGWPFRPGGRPGQPAGAEPCWLPSQAAAPSQPGAARMLATSKKNHFNLPQGEGTYQGVTVPCPLATAGHH